MLSSVIGSSVGYGLLLGFLALSGCASLLAYWLHRRHPVLAKRMPWLTLLSSAFGLLLSLILVLHIYLPHLPSLSAHALPCTALYVASHLYCGLILLPYILRTVRLLSLYSPTSTDDSRRGKQLAPSFYPLTLALTLSLLAAAGVLVYFFGGDSERSEVDNSTSEQCLLFDYWQYFAPLCGWFFLVWSWLLLKLSESQREDPYLLCFEQSACWLSTAILLVSYFVLVTLPSSSDIETAFPIEWLVVALNFCLQAFSVWLPLYYVWQFNRQQRNNAASGVVEQEERAPAVAPSTSKAGKRDLQRSIELTRAGDDKLTAPQADERDELNKSTTLDGLPVASHVALSKQAVGAVSGGAVDITNVWSIDRILADPVANALLEHHAQRFLCSELVLCWNDVQKHNATPWRLDSTTDLDAAYSSGLAIYSTYIKAGSLYEVNVDSKIRSALAGIFDKPHSTHERRALMVRDLHAKRKLMREMDRRSAAAADRRRAQHNRTQDSTRVHASQLTAVSQIDRPHTPTLSRSQRMQQQQSRPMLGQTANSAIVVLDEGDEQQPGAEPGDIVRTLQPANTGDVTTLRAITTDANYPLRARNQRAATVNYGNHEPLALQPPVVVDLASSNVFSQTLQMPLTYDNTGPIYHTATAGDASQASASGQQEQHIVVASTATLTQSSTAVSVSTGRTVRSQSLGVPFFQRQRALVPAAEGSSTGPVSMRHRRASSEQSMHASGRRTSATASASQLHITSDSALPTIINYHTPNTSQLPHASTSHLDLVHAPDMQRAESENQKRGHSTAHAAQQPHGAATSLRPSTPSASSNSFNQSVSSSTPFPLSALELAALSSQLIFHRCAHEVKKLLDTNLYLSFIRQSAEFRKFRLQRRKEEREAALATRRQMQSGSITRRGESQVIVPEAVQIMIISQGDSAESAPADAVPLS